MRCKACNAKIEITEELCKDCLEAALYYVYGDDDEDVLSTIVPYDDEMDYDDLNY